MYQVYPQEWEWRTTLRGMAVALGISGTVVQPMALDRLHALSVFEGKSGSVYHIGGWNLISIWGIKLRLGVSRLCHPPH